jgi:WD40 repeat protein
VAQERLTRARQLGGEALLAIDGDPERGILLALEAMGTHRDERRRPLPEAISALQTALQASRVELHVPEGELVVAVSPDGRMLATDSFRDANSVRVLALASGATVTRLEGAGEVGGAAFSPDGTTLAVSYEDTEGRPAVELFDVGTWQRTATFEGPPAPYGQVAFTDDGGSSLVAQGEGVGLTGWDLASGDPVEFDAPSAIDFATVSGSSTIAVTERAEEVRFVDARDGRTVEVLPTPGVTGVSVAIDVTGTRVALTSRGDPREVSVWDRATHERLASFPNPSANGVVFSPDGRLAHSSNDGTVRIVGIGDESPEELVLAGHSDGVTSIDFTGDGRHLVSVSWADETRVWDVSPGGPDALGNLPIGEGRAWDVVPSPENDRIAITVDLPADSQRVVTLAPSTGASTIRIDGLWRAIHHMAHVSRDLSTVAALDPDHRASVHDLSTGEPLLQLPPCLSPRGISPDGSRLVVDGRLLCTITKQSDRIVPDPPADAVLRSAVVDARTGTVLRDLGERPISWAVLGPPGTPFERYAVVVVGFVEVELHDLENDTLVGSLALTDEAILTLGGSDDGRHVVLNAQSGRAFVLDLLAAESGASLEDAMVLTALDPAGGPLIHSSIVDGRLATSTMAGHVRVLDLDDGSLLVDLEVDATGPAPIGFTDSGAQLYYTDGAVLRRFEVDPDRLVALARSRLTRGFTAEECEQYGIESDPCRDVRSR